MNNERFASELKKYDVAFERFINKHNLPAEWFQRPDHVAIKCADGEDYKETCNEFSTLVQGGIWETKMNDRKLASAQLLSALTIATYEFGWLEIMQPRPGKEMTAGFVEHTEFLFADFEQIQIRLTDGGIEYTLQQNPSHSWVNLVIDGLGREIKFNDKSLKDVSADEQARGELYLRQ